MRAPRMVAQGGGSLVKNVIQVGARQKPAVQSKQELMEFEEEGKSVEKARETLPRMTGSEEKATEIIESAYKIAKEVRMGADKYADEVLTNLEATSSRILRAVKAGRARLNRTVTHEIKEEDR